MIFKGVQEGRPYPALGLTPREWAQIPPRQFRLDQLNTVTTVLALDKLLSEDSTFYGDLFAHVVHYQGELYLEDGLHRAVRSALRNRTIVHARLLDLDEVIGSGGAIPVATSDAVGTANSFAIPMGATDQLPPTSARPANPRRARPSRG
ncbi:MAG: type II toxin-antitoxin system VapB family antitoxin, partial [Gordonia sp. (in: high G+C Gram-positive bacteria)]|uniref:type II toxin-antitoxin system VapB family antitoxin n=1 Tax=Gordonia sp. (in: high G+C Gram-positive bacteria) TaxID=84139 RepID=UPI003BB7E348